jgi:ABC-type glycerol-3-phosphate transport system permease component
VSKNHVFDTLTDGGYDPVGLVAYSLYKSHKRQWAQDIRDKHKREPEPNEELIFASTNTLEQLDRYRNQAQEILTNYGNAFVEDAREDISKNAIAGRIETALQKVEGHHKWWSSILRSVIVAVITTIVLVLILSYADNKDFNPIDFFTSLIN